MICLNFESSEKMFFKRTIILVVFLFIIDTVNSDKHLVNNRTSTNLKKHMGEKNEDYSPGYHGKLGGCGNCNIREDIKSRSLEVIKKEFLSKMGFSAPPNMTGKTLPEVPAHYLEEYGMQSDEPDYKTGFRVHEEEDEYHVKTQKILTFAQQYPRLRHGWHGQDILHFVFSDSNTKFHVANATLYIYLKGAEKRPYPSVLIEVFKVLKSPDRPEAPEMKRVYSRKVSQPSGRGDWFKIDFSETVSEWFKNGRDNYGFIINATANGKKVVVTDVEKKGKVPYVEISTTESRRRIRRSMSLHCDDSTNEHLCCRYPLTVDFEAFGWDFIIAPKKYDAHYCTGECPMLTYQKGMHTHLVKMSNSNSVQPCCVPRKLSPISMLYFDQQLNVVYGSLPNMVVDRCGCS